MPLLDRIGQQRRAYTIGRIRTGHKVPTGKVDKWNRPKYKPVALGKFRLTCSSEEIIHAAAALYGGTPRPWADGPGQQWELFTDTNQLLVVVPPQDGVITQHYEHWAGGRCLRRCDSVRVEQTGQPCVCPADGRERSRLSKLNPPQACKTVTRVNVRLPELPGLGLWLLASGSFDASEEVAQLDEVLLELARRQGVMTPCRLFLEARQRMTEEGLRSYYVPVLDTLHSLREIASGALRTGPEAQLPPAPGEPLRAITAAPSRPVADPLGLPPTATAQDFARAALATTDPDVVRAIGQRMSARGIDNDQIEIDGALETLRPFLEARHQELLAARQAPPTGDGQDWPDVVAPGTAPAPAGHQ